jgi:hypothetical protein
MKTVRDIQGNELQLTSNRLVELTKSSKRCWSVTFANLRLAKDDVLIDALLKHNPDWSKATRNLMVTFDARLGIIGCHQFNIATFKKIMATANKAKRKSR